MQVIKMNAQLEECSGKNAKVYGTPSLIHCQEPGDMMGKEHGTPSLNNRLEAAGMTDRRVVLPGGRGGKLHSEHVGRIKNL